eukprot:2101018-Lingulodinium_polyedra.AAC.1
MNTSELQQVDLHATLCGCDVIGALVRKVVRARQGEPRQLRRPLRRVRPGTGASWRGSRRGTSRVKS